MAVALFVDDCPDGAAINSKALAGAGDTHAAVVIDKPILFLLVRVALFFLVERRVLLFCVTVSESVLPNLIPTAPVLCDYHS